MARRAKRRNGSPKPAAARTPSRKGEEPTGALAAALRAWKDRPEVTDTDESAPTSSAASARPGNEPARATRAPDTPPAEPPTSPAQPAREILTPEEAMRRAFESEDASFWDGKFQGRGVSLPEHVAIVGDRPASSGAAEPEGDDEGDASDDAAPVEPLSREERAFLDAMGAGVEPLDDHPLRRRLAELQRRHGRDPSRGRG